MTASRRPDPWERQPGEGAKPYAAFSTYRDMGVERSTAKVAREIGKSLAMIHRWSQQHAWVLRAAAYDREEDRQYRLAQAAARRRMATRHARIAGAMQSKLVDRLQSLDISRLSLRDMALWLDVTAKVERAALGAPDRVELTGPDGGPVEVAHLSDEDRRARLLELRRELEQRIGAHAVDTAYLDEDPAEDTPAIVDPPGPLDDG